MRFSSLLLAFLAVLSVLALAFTPPASQSQVSQEPPPWYWFRVGAYAKYKVDGSPMPSVIRVKGEEYKVDYNKVFIVWNITGIEGEWFTVNQSVVFEDAVRLRDNAKIPVLVAASKELRVNIKTLTALTRFSDSRLYNFTNIYLVLGDYVWAFDWIFLIAPDMPIKLYNTIIPWGGGGFFVRRDGQAYKDLWNFVLKVNETISMLTNGTRRYDLEALEKPESIRDVGGELAFFNICPAGKPVKRSNETELLEILSRYVESIGVKLVKLADPPAPKDYSFGGIRLGRERLMSLGDPSESVRKLLFRYAKLNSMIVYSLAELNFTDPLLKPYNETVLITVRGHTYCINPYYPDISEAYYDVVSGILVYMRIKHRSYTDFLWIERGSIEVVKEARMGLPDYEIKLVETNIDLNRPVIGGTKTTTPTKATTTTTTTTSPLETATTPTRATPTPPPITTTQPPPATSVPEAATATIQTTPTHGTTAPATVSVETGEPELPFRTTWSPTILRPGEAPPTPQPVKPPGGIPLYTIALVGLALLVAIVAVVFYGRR